MSGPRTQIPTKRGIDCSIQKASAETASLRSGGTPVRPLYIVFDDARRIFADLVKEIDLLLFHHSHVVQRVLLQNCLPQVFSLSGNSTSHRDTKLAISSPSLVSLPVSYASV